MGTSVSPCPGGEDGAAVCRVRQPTPVVKEERERVRAGAYYLTLLPARSRPRRPSDGILPTQTPCSALRGSSVAPPFTTRRSDVTMGHRSVTLQ